MFRRLLGLVAVAALLVATGWSAPAAGAEDIAAQAFEIDLDVQHGQTVELENGAFQITFVDVQEDSRCPKDVLCVWQGQAITTMHVVADGTDHGDVSLSLLALAPTGASPTVTLGAYTLRLDYLAPYPSASQPTPHEQYMATVHVQRS
jgi:hypothetical protein